MGRLWKLADTYATLPAVILAGAPAEADLAGKYSVKWRASVPIAGKMMVQYVTDALAASSRVKSVSLVGEIACEGIDKTIRPESTIMDNLMAGVKAHTGHVLVVTSDIPFITPAAIDNFIDECGDLSADFYYPIIPREANEKRFPGMRRTYAKLAEGTFTGGNIMVVNADFLRDNIDTIREVLNARKNVLKLAGIIGMGVLLRAVIAQVLWSKAINIPMLEKAVGRILNGKIKAVPTSYAEIGADVDEIEQIELAESVLTS